MISLSLALLLQGAQLPEVVTRARVDRSRPVEFRALVVPETVYVGQQATYQLGVFLDSDTRQRIRRNPEFQPPETRSLLAYDLRERPTGPLTTSVGGRPYEVHVFRRAVFPLTSGRYEIAAARLTYALPQSSSFFSREESFTLRSEPVAFVAIEPPTAGRPADWAGAVGSWRASARVDTSRVRARDAVVLTLRVEGRGNVTLLPRPPLAISGASVVTADERVRMDSTPSLLGGVKEFDWLVSPTAEGTLRIPSIRYAYFDPAERRYEFAESAPLELRVAAAADAGVSEGGRADAVGDSAGVPLAAPLVPLTVVQSLGPAGAGAFGRDIYWLLLLVAAGPLASLAAWLVRRPRRAPRPLTPLERLDALSRGGTAMTPTAATTGTGGVPGLLDARRAFMDGLAAVTGLAAVDLTAHGDWTSALGRAGLTPDRAREVEAFLDELDTAGFGDPSGDRAEAGRHPTVGTAASAAAVAETARKLLGEIERECRDRSRRPVRSGGARRWRSSAQVRAVLMATALAGANGIAASRGAAQTTSQDAEKAFALGVTAYSGGDFVRAERYFGDAAHAAPRAPDAWANFGTAAFMAGDTANAIVGWQRALRLEPLDADLRARIARIRAVRAGEDAWVPPAPPRALPILAVVFWLSAWTWIARRAWQRRPVLRVASVVLVVGAGVLAGAWQVDRRHAGAGFVVVTSPVSLRQLPALASETRATPLLGEVARVTQRQGAWVHLRLRADRSGWIPRDRVALLSDESVR